MKTENRVRSTESVQRRTFNRSNRAENTNLENGIHPLCFASGSLANVGANDNFNWYVQNAEHVTIQLTTRSYSVQRMTTNNGP